MVFRGLPRSCWEFFSGQFHPKFLRGANRGSPQTSTGTISVARTRRVLLALLDLLPVSLVLPHLILFHRPDARRRAPAHRLDRKPTGMADANVILGSNRLIPLAGKTTVTHGTRNKVLDLLGKEHKRPRTMIMDITALVWNHDTYAVVGGALEKVAVRVRDKEELLQHVRLERVSAAGKGDDKGATEAVGGKHGPGHGFLVPPSSVGWPATWVPGGARLSNVSELQSGGMLEFVFEPAVDPNNDRLEKWEQLVTGPSRHLETNRAQVASGSIRNMMRFYELDKVICWDLTWGIWEATRVDQVDEAGFPCVAIHGSPTDLVVGDANNLVDWSRDFNALAKPITTAYRVSSIL